MNGDELANARRRAIGDRYSQTSAILSEISNTLNDDTFHQAMVDQVNISSAYTGKRKGILTPEDLSSRWGIGLDTAAKMLKVTTQRGICTVTNPMLSCQFRTNDRHLQYRRLRTDVFGDTMFSNIMSQRSNKCAQVFTTSFHWSRACPIPRKSSVHEGLLLMFKWDVVPINMIIDGAR